MEKEEPEESFTNTYQKYVACSYGHNKKLVMTKEDDEGY